MSEAATLDDLAVALRALRLLSADFGHLPAPVVHVSDIFPAQLRLSIYDDLGAFEVWREALAVAPEKVTHGVQGEGMTRVLTALTDYAGAKVRLVGYADVPVVDGGAA
ncbi:hypothetical protein [Streptomyces sp. TRM68416]|uniref:hypothetical protein n=1 Tax=Streptomyces sp. TRM68416 TaxID=2758412 RepID=UPI001661C9DF|nr:hypothetical protein [Streptomyces sp. TRM68416]MBD0838859.1 hypothetical protein [Streptomyces sp. TRM68416]